MQDNQPVPISPEVSDLYNYLTDRAFPIDNETLDRAGIKLAGAEAIAEALGFHIPNAKGLVISYPGTDYQTARLVPGGPRCPKGVTPHAYLPRWVNWNTVRGTLYLCESPLKALTLAMAGFNAMSAGGTTTLYMASKDKWCVGFPHAAIDSGAIDLIRIAFDSDTEGSNHNVSRDVRTLARALRERHPDTPIKVHVLPPNPDTGEDWGLDDAHAYHGPEWLNAWASLAEADREPEADPLQDHLDQLNAKYVACLTPERVINLETGAMHTDAQFKNFVEAWREIPGQQRPVKVAPVWLARRDRPTVEKIEYQPGQGVISADGSTYNLWRPSPLIPRAGDPSPWLELLDDAVRDKETLRLAIECMAFQTQNRGERLEKILYFVGREVGTGKSTQARIMQQIIGPRNTGWVTKTELEGAHNACWAAKELVVLDDIEKLKRDTWARLKTMVTSREVTLTEKYLPAWTQQNYAQMYVTANQTDILATDADDRRILMINFEPTVLHRDHDDPYWGNFQHWLDHQGGLEAIAHYLGTYDLSNFNPHFFPPQSDIKMEAAQSRMSDLESFLVDFIEAPETFAPGRKAITSFELYSLYKGSEAQDYDRDDVTRMVKIISAKQYLKRIKRDRVEIDSARCYVYWVPGHVQDEVNMPAIRYHIIKTPIDLYQGL